MAYRIPLLLMVVLVSLTAAVSGAPLADLNFRESREWQALNRLVGTWEEEATVTVPQPSKARVSVATTWVLGDRFLQSKSRSDLDRSESMSLYTWDQNRRALRAWWFHSMGFSAAFTGSWDDASSTFTFKVDDIAPSSSTVTNHLIDDDHYEWKVITKDPDGKVVHEMSGKATRQKPGKAAGEAAPPKTAAETIGRIFELLKAGDFDAAAEYFHPAGDRRADIKEELRRAVTRIGEGGFSVTAADSKEDGDLAVVILKVVENRKPDDAVVGYEINRMVRRDGIWRIYENIDDAKLDGTAREKMDSLGKWGQGRSQQLRKAEESATPAGLDKPPKEIAIDCGKDVQMKLVYIPPGKFLMGSPAKEQGRSDNETQHEVTLTKGFYLGVFEVTQEQYEAVMGKNPSEFKGARNPVEKVSWTDATEFCKKLSEKTGRRVSLPTEAEWEYACRAGGTGPIAGTGKLDEMAWHGGNSDKTTHPVGQKAPNAWGLYDMHGNVWEWCLDFWPDDPSGTAVSDPWGKEGDLHRLRGGCFSDVWESYFRCAFRMDLRLAPPDYRITHPGFRIAVSAPRQKK